MLGRRRKRNTESEVEYANGADGCKRALAVYCCRERAERRCSTAVSVQTLEGLAGLAARNSGSDIACHGQVRVPDGRLHSGIGTSADEAGVKSPDFCLKARRP